MKSMFSVVLTCVVVAPVSAETLLFDFGRTDLQSNPNWNNIVPATTTLFALFDSDGNIYNAGAGLEITDTFFQTGEPSRLGSEAPAGDAAGYPVSATDDYFFGHTTNFAGADPNPLGQVRLFGLEADKLYDFTFFASRQTVGDTREATYAVAGANAASGVLNASNNNTEVLRLTGIGPDGNDEIFVDVTPGPNNDNNNGFYYIGLMQVDVTPIPEPLAMSLLLAGLSGSLLLRRRA
jgi:hypothetical protein